MGTVYAATDTLANDRVVALKCLWPGSAGGALLDTLRAEFRILATLHHPLLCQVYDFGRLPPGVELPGGGQGAGYFLSRELLEGRDLADAAAGADPGRVARLFSRAAAGLAALHQAGLRHGDFKPANAIVGADGSVRLIDFGLTTSEGNHHSGGTPPYIAPEVFAGRADRRADLYALGISLYEVLAGELPSGDLRGGALIRWHQRGSRPALAGFGDELADLTARLIDPDPSRRLPTASEVEAALDDIADHLGAPGGDIAAPALVIEPLARPAIAEAERRLLARCRGGGGGAVIELAGDPGSGRSTALTELGWRAQLEGVEVIAGMSGGERPFAAIGPALDQLAALAGRPLPAGSAVAVAARFAELARWLIDAVRFPTALVLDDFDAADPGSRSLVSYLARALPERTPLAIAVARDRGAALAPDSVVIEMAELSNAEIATLVKRAAGRDDADLARRIEAHTGGNLLHVVSTLESLAAVDFAPSESLDQLPAPARLIEDAAGWREIDEPGRSILAALAVLGRPARLDTLAAIAGGDVDRIRPALRSLPLQETRRGELGFRRVALGAAIAGGLAPERRRALHRRAVEVLTARGAAADSPEVVSHRIAAGDAGAVAETILAAVESIAAGGDHAAALHLGERALELDGVGDSDALRRRLGQLAQLGGDAERCRRLLGPLADAGDPRAALSLARALDAAGDVDAAETRFRQAMADAETAAPATRDLCYQLLRRGEAEAALEVADAVSGDDPHLEAARAYAHGVLDRDDGAVDRIEAIGAVARSQGDRDLEAAALHLAGRLAYRRGDWRATRRTYERALEAAEAAGDMVRVGTLRMNLAAMDQSIGEWRRARDFGNQAVSLLRAAGARTYALIARRNLGQLMCELGQYQLARRELGRAAVEADELKMPVHRIGIDALLGIVAARTGELGAGRELLAGAVEDFAELGDDRRCAETLLDLAELELELAGDPVAGGHILDRAETLEPTRDHPGRRCRLAAARALEAALRGDRAETRRRLAELDAVEGELADQGGDPLRAELHRLAARAAELGGDPETADRHRRATVELLEAIAADLSPADRLSFWQDPRRRELSGQRPASRVSARDSTVLGKISSGQSASVRSVNRLFRVLDVYRQLSGEADPDRLLEQAMDRAIELFGASRGFLLLASNEGLAGRGGEPPARPDDHRRLRTAVARNLPAGHLDSMRRRDSEPPGAPGDDLPYSRSVAEEVFRTGEPIIGDVTLDSRFANAASVHALDAPTVICVPACASGEVVGALYLESAALGLAVGRDDARLLGAFGDQIAVLLREAETKRVLARRAEQLEKARAEIEGLLAERTRLLERRTEELELVKRDLSQISRRLLGDGGAFGLIGSSRPMERIYEAIDRAARTDVPILITGESGTGKELVARALHQQSGRADKKLVAVNCGALPETLLESELFGHERGAFTGAERARRGLFETADGGTLFLDEIGETPPRMQAALLRALQDGIIRRVGGTGTIEVDVRIIAATNRDLHELVAADRFRADLLYRLEVVPIRVPPLRERLEDVPLLVEHFLGSLRERTNQPDLAVSSQTLKQLMSFPWPGNVRQLEHALTSAAVMAAGTTLEPADFDAVLGSPAVGPAPRARERDERELILEALEQCNWNKSKAARVMGIPRRTFYRRLKKYDIG